MQRTTGIPTKSRGYQMRSRLEAKWAEFFTALGWDWEYEPIDTPGWIPDFGIKTHDGRLLLVEVKPVIRHDEDVAKKCERALHSAGMDNEIIICGLKPYDLAPDSCIGSFAEHQDGQWLWSHAALQLCFCAEHGRHVGVCSLDGGYTDRITGKYDGALHSTPFSFIEGVWADCCNKTQWMARSAS